ncbi:acyl carrier protein [Micromonospora sp. DT48]|uniref:acyl carrier protein n=1 Tax=unclassified Micromonospora TaxID=2617518 RepID=UPI0018AD1297|nr:acyl carrier protein [Micromonospora sp. CP22]
MSESSSQPEAVTVDQVAAEIVSPVLGVPSVAPDEDFFDHDATSLHLVRMAADAYQRYGVELPLPELFDEPTARGLCRLIREELGAAAGTP